MSANAEAARAGQARAAQTQAGYLPESVPFCIARLNG